jgi:hypothetical protein
VVFLLLEKEALFPIYAEAPHGLAMGLQDPHADWLPVRMGVGVVLGRADQNEM